MKFATISAIAFGAVSCYASVISRDGEAKCNNGPAQCCNDLKEYSEYDRDQLNALFGIGVKDILKGQLGLNCSPIIPILGGNQCTQQAVCCDKVGPDFIGINCNAISL